MELLLRSHQHCPPHPPLTFMGCSCTRVMREGSTTGLGRRRVSRMFCHCGGRPTNLPSLGSKEVWTRCWKFWGAEISGRFFFFLRNMAPARGGASWVSAQGLWGGCSGCWGNSSGLAPLSAARPLCPWTGTSLHVHPHFLREMAGSQQTSLRNNKSATNKPTQTINKEKRCLSFYPCQASRRGGRLWGCVFIKSTVHYKYHPIVRVKKGGERVEGSQTPFMKRVWP